MNIFIYCGSSSSGQEDLKVRLAAAGHQVWISGFGMARGTDVVDVLIFLDGEFKCLGQPPAQSFADVLLEMAPKSLILLSSELAGIRGISPETKTIHQRLLRNEQIVALWQTLSGRKAKVVRARFRPDAVAHIAEICRICEEMNG